MFSDIVVASTMWKMETDPSTNFGHGRARVEPIFAAAEARRCVGAEFGLDDQHDAVEFLERWFDRARRGELEAFRSASWDRVVVGGVAAATHVDRLFGYVREECLQCRQCRGAVRCRHVGEFVFRVRPRELAGGPMTIAEMYLDACGPEVLEAQAPPWPML